MATYVNNLRLKEIATGDEDGTWGTSTNTNLELIGEGFGYGTQEVAADANETFTMADGVADGVRGMYLKFTSAGSLTATRELTLAPNTVSKVWIIENATTGSQIITIKQGAGATINVASGAKKMVYTDGAGSGAAVFDANPTEVGGTVTSVATAGTVNGITLTGGPITGSGTVTLGGTLGSVSLTSQVTGTLPVANGGTGITSLGTGVAAWWGTPSSANLATAVTDETGSGSLVFATSPTFVTPVLGTPASGTATNLTGLPPAGVTGTAAILGANTFTALQTEAAGADIASATAVDLTGATGNVVVITGTTPSTSLTMTAGQQMILIAAAAWPLTFHATTMNITGGVSYTCAAGDRLYVTKDVDNVIRVSVLKQDGTAVVPGAASSVAVGDITGAGTGVLTALAVNVGSAGAPVVLNGALGTPSGGTLTSVSGLPPAGVVGTAAILGANTFTALQTLSTGADIASATAVDLTAATGNAVVITGTTESTSLTMTAGQQMVLLPSAAWPLTFHATTMNINGGVSYTCAAGDRIYAVKDLANVIRVSVTKQDGTAVVAGVASSVAVGNITGAGTGVLTALAVNVGSAGAPVVLNGALGTPSTGTLTNVSGLPPAGVTGTAAILGANTFTALQTLAAGADIASATAVDLTGATGNAVVITGTTPSTSLTMTAGQQMVLLPSAAWPLTYHATTMNINGGVSYTCAAGDRLYVAKDVDNVIRVSVLKQDGTSVVAGVASSVAVGNITGLASNVATFLATSTSANLATAVTDETGTGLLVFGTSPDLTTPKITTGLQDSAANSVIPFDTNQYFSGTFSDQVTALGDTGTAKTINANTGNVYTATLTGNATITLATPNSVSNRATSFTLILTNDGTPSRTVALSGGSFEYPGGSVSRTTDASATDIWFFFSPDGGTTWYVTIPMKDLS